MDIKWIKEAETGWRPRTRSQWRLERLKRVFFPLESSPSPPILTPIIMTHPDSCTSSLNEGEHEFGNLEQGQLKEVTDYGPPDLQKEDIENDEIQPDKSDVALFAKPKARTPRPATVSRRRRRRAPITRKKRKASKAKAEELLLLASPKITKQFDYDELLKRTKAQYLLDLKKKTNACRFFHIRPLIRMVTRNLIPRLKIKAERCQQSLHPLRLLILRTRDAAIQSVNNVDLGIPDSVIQNIIEEVKLQVVKVNNGWEIAGKADILNFGEELTEHEMNPIVMEEKDNLIGGNKINNIKQEIFEEVTSSVSEITAQPQISVRQSATRNTSGNSTQYLSFSGREKLIGTGSKVIVTKKTMKSITPSGDSEKHEGSKDYFKKVTCIVPTTQITDADVKSHHQLEEPMEVGAFKIVAKAKRKKVSLPKDIREWSVGDVKLYHKRMTSRSRRNLPICKHEGIRMKSRSGRQEPTGDVKGETYKESDSEYAKKCKDNDLNDDYSKKAKEVVPATPMTQTTGDHGKLYPENVEFTKLNSLKVETKQVNSSSESDSEDKQSFVVNHLNHDYLKAIDLVPVIRLAQRTGGHRKLYPENVKFIESNSLKVKVETGKEKQNFEVNDLNDDYLKTAEQTNIVSINPFIQPAGDRAESVLTQEDSIRSDPRKIIFNKKLKTDLSSDDYLNNENNSIVISNNFIMLKARHQVPASPASTIDNHFEIGKSFAVHSLKGETKKISDVDLYHTRENKQTNFNTKLWTKTTFVPITQTTSDDFKPNLQLQKPIGTESLQIETRKKRRLFSDSDSDSDSDSENTQGYQDNDLKSKMLKKKTYFASTISIPGTQGDEINTICQLEGSNGSDSSEAESSEKWKIEMDADLGSISLEDQGNCLHNDNLQYKQTNCLPPADWKPNLHLENPIGIQSPQTENSNKKELFSDSSDSENTQDHEDNDLKDEVFKKETYFAPTISITETKGDEFNPLSQREESNGTDSSEAESSEKLKIDTDADADSDMESISSVDQGNSLHRDNLQHNQTSCLPSDCKSNLHLENAFGIQSLQIENTNKRKLFSDSSDSENTQDHEDNDLKNEMLKKKTYSAPTISTTFVPITQTTSDDFKPNLQLEKPFGTESLQIETRKKRTLFSDSDSENTQDHEDNDLKSKMLKKKTYSAPTISTPETKMDEINPLRQHEESNETDSSEAESSKKLKIDTDAYSDTDAASDSDSDADSDSESISSEDQSNSNYLQHKQTNCVPTIPITQTRSGDSKPNLQLENVIGIQSLKIENTNKRKLFSDSSDSENIQDHQDSNLKNKMLKRTTDFFPTIPINKTEGDDVKIHIKLEELSGTNSLKRDGREELKSESESNSSEDECKSLHIESNAAKDERNSSHIESNASEDECNSLPYAYVKEKTTIRIAGISTTKTTDDEVSRLLRLEKPNEGDFWKIVPSTKMKSASMSNSKDAWNFGDNSLLDNYMKLKAKNRVPPIPIPRRMHAKEFMQPNKTPIVKNNKPVMPIPNNGKTLFTNSPSYPFSTSEAKKSMPHKIPSSMKNVNVLEKTRKAVSKDESDDSSESEDSSDEEEDDTSTSSGSNSDNSGSSSDSSGSRSDSSGSSSDSSGSSSDSSGSSSD